MGEKSHCTAYVTSIGWWLLVDLNRKRSGTKQIGAEKMRGENEEKKAENNKREKKKKMHKIGKQRIKTEKRNTERKYTRRWTQKELQSERKKEKRAINVLSNSQKLAPEWKHVFDCIWCVAFVVWTSERREVIYILKMEISRALFRSFALSISTSLGSVSFAILLMIHIRSIFALASVLALALATWHGLLVAKQQLCMACEVLYFGYTVCVCVQFHNDEKKETYLISIIVVIISK